MRFGGHETFAIREGWLHKGLRLLVEEPQLLVDDYAADWLGVGRNMAKSIRYWLAATGLADARVLATGRDVMPPEPTALGRMIWKRDRYFARPGSLWALHVNLVNNVQMAYAWNWFFNNFALPRFDRALCIDRLGRHLRLTQARMPNPKTIQREIACLLQTYARPVPAKAADPEEAQDCPFLELGLLTLFTDSGTYRLREGSRADIPFELFCYAVAKTFQASKGSAHVEFSIREAAVEAGSPGRVFALSEEAVFDLVSTAETQQPADLSIRNVAGERLIRIPAAGQAHWLERYFDIAEEGEEDAA